jgi:hypothetical protein
MEDLAEQLLIKRARFDASFSQRPAISSRIWNSMAIPTDEEQSEDGCHNTGKGSFPFPNMYIAD